MSYLFKNAPKSKAEWQSLLQERDSRIAELEAALSKQDAEQAGKRERVVGEVTVKCFTPHGTAEVEGISVYGLEVGDTLYTAPPSTAQGVSEALERELNMIEMTLTQFDTPAKAIQELINWHVAVENDPKVNGGMVKVPVEFIEVLDYAPVINPSNYNHDQVCKLSTAVEEALSMLTASKGE